MSPKVQPRVNSSIQIDLPWLDNIPIFSNMKTKHPCRHRANLALSAALCAALPAFADGPKLPGIGAAMQEMIVKNEIAGAVTVVVTKDKLLHLESTGVGDGAAGTTIAPATPF